MSTELTICALYARLAEIDVALTQIGGERS